jgi:hypothetical protein
VPSVNLPDLARANIAAPAVAQILPGPAAAPLVQSQSLAILTRANFITAPALAQTFLWLGRS